MDVYGFLRAFFGKAARVPSGCTGAKEPAFAELAMQVDMQGLSYLGVEALVGLAQTMIEVNESGVPGVVLEAGCALGGSAIVLAAAKGCDRPLYVYDVFGMIPEPSGHDGPDVHQRYEVIRSGRSEGLKGGEYYGYTPDLLTTISKNFADAGYPAHQNSVRFVKGLYEDTLYPKDLIALAHIDCDWYESVKVCLERIGPCLSVGGRMVIDDYDHYSGCRLAVDEYVARHSSEFKCERRVRLHIVRVAAA
ncbi:MAG: TylF/MycF family methyltransferase [Desulfovibrio sp.]|jgi:asparagine synthase (glutamine-hydrolysing)|nr:TylF/MycF family methyltransferase [Desulfovibrio sp.]